MYRYCQVWIHETSLTKVCVAANAIATIGNRAKALKRVWLLCLYESMGVIQIVVGPGARPSPGG